MAGKESEKATETLLNAIEAGNLARVQELIKAGADVSECEEYSPLSRAAEMGRADMVDALLKAKADVNFGPVWLPLCCAVRSRDVATVKRLLEAKPKLDAQEEEGTTALMYAAGIANLEMVKMLVAAGASPKKKDEDGETAIVYGKDSPEIFEFLKPLSPKADVSYLEKQAAEPDAATEEFLAAIKAGDAARVKALLEKKVKLGALGKNGQAALHVAVETQNQEIVELLLKAGASPNVRNQYGRTPIFEAVKRHNASLIERLIQAGADVNVKEKLGGETPFLSSVSNVEGSPKIMRLLAKHGADVFAIDTYDRSALNIASRWLGQKDYHSEKDRLIADGLRKAFVDAGVLHPDSARFTEAAAAGDVPAVRKFIEAGVSVNAVDEEERTALYMAISRGHPELVKFLLEKGADVHRPAGSDSAEDKRWGGKDCACPKCGNVFAALTLTRHCPKCQKQFKAQEAFGEGGGELFMMWSNSQPPLVTAAWLGDPQIVGLLLDAGADPNRGLRKVTPIMYAGYFGHLEVTRTLIARGADPKHEGRTPDRVGDKISAIGYAANNQHIELVKLLWDAGVPGEAKNSTLLVLAIRKNDLATIKQLLAEGTDVNRPDPITGQKPLDTAAREGHAGAASLLTGAGATINPPAKDFPPLWQALSGLERLGQSKPLPPEAVERYTQVINVLLEAGALPDASVYGMTPVNMAERLKCPSLVERLKAAVEAKRKP